MVRSSIARVLKWITKVETWLGILERLPFWERIVAFLLPIAAGVWAYLNSAPGWAVAVIVLSFAASILLLLNWIEISKQRRPIPLLDRYGQTITAPSPGTQGVVGILALLVAVVLFSYHLYSTGLSAPSDIQDRQAARGSSPNNKDSESQRPETFQFGPANVRDWGLDRGVAYVTLKTSELLPLAEKHYFVLVCMNYDVLVDYRMKSPVSTSNPFHIKSGETQLRVQVSKAILDGFKASTELQLVVLLVPGGVDVSGIVNVQEAMNLGSQIAADPRVGFRSR